MKFPGSRLLHSWDLALRPLSFEDVLRSCRQAGLTGLAEARTEEGVGMIFYYLGSEVNALYREGPVVSHGQAAVDKVSELIARGEGVVAVYELPLDLAHLLRGITNRRRLDAPVLGREGLAAVLTALEREGRTGTLELQTSAGTALVLLVNGRASNTYWESARGQTLEQEPARRKLEAALDQEPAAAFLSEFSPQAWRLRSSAAGAPAPSPGSSLETPRAEEELALRRALLEEVSRQLPAVMQAFVFDMLTGAVLARTGRGAAALRPGLLGDRLPAMALYLQELFHAEDQGQLDVVELSSEKVSTVIVVVPGQGEAVAVLVDKAQPTALIRAVLARAVQAHVARGTSARPA